MHQKTLRYVVFLLLALFLLGGCASNVSKDVSISEDVLAKYEHMKPKEAIEAYKKQIDTARTEMMPFYVPNHFAEAEKTLEKAREDFKKYKKKDRLVNLLAQGEAVLAKGKRVMANVKRRLETELALKDSLYKLGAHQLFKDEYDDVIADLSDVIEDVELDKSGADKNKKSLRKDMQALELKTIKYLALNDAKNLLDEVQANDAEKEAPVTYAEAVNIYNQSVARIERSPHDEEGVKEASAKALFAAKHAKYVVQRVKALHPQYEKAPESIILDEELRLKKIADALKHDDVRDRNIDQQISTLADAVAPILAAQDDQQDLVKKLEEMKEEKSKLEKTIADLNTSSELLRKEKEKMDEQIVRLSAQVVQLDRELKAALEGNEKAVEYTPEVAPIEQKTETKPEATPVEQASETASVEETEVSAVEVEEEAPAQ